MRKQGTNIDKSERRTKRFRIPRIPRSRGALPGSPPGGGGRLLQL